MIMFIINKSDVKSDARKILVVSGISEVYLWTLPIMTVKDRIVSEEQKHSQQFKFIIKLLGFK